MPASAPVSVKPESVAVSTPAFFEPNAAVSAAPERLTASLVIAPVWPVMEPVDATVAEVVASYVLLATVTPETVICACEIVAVAALGFEAIT
ncbi:hypothetical protein AWB78_08538 [Caballeronia calidae]|uniref:Uncharacterized protein n=1 Tax=Caballeronia calidae TaxID=1777139 RepID=A0A158EKS6_9BURK|nr:hypothetical protein AWB78_08538 [Caballeronia calidae]